MNYHTSTTGASIHDFQTAFAKSIALAIENDSNEVVVLVHGKNNLHGIIKDAIGGIANKLENDGGTQIGVVKVYLETERKKSTFKSGVILASHISSELLAKVLVDKRATDVVYVPWAQEELKQYLNFNKSVEL